MITPMNVQIYLRPSELPDCCDSQHSSKKFQHEKILTFFLIKILFRKRPHKRNSNERTCSWWKIQLSSQVVGFFSKNFKKFSVLYLRKNGKFSFHVVMLDNQMIFWNFSEFNFGLIYSDLPWLTRVLDLENIETLHYDIVSSFPKIDT